MVLGGSSETQKRQVMLLAHKGLPIKINSLFVEALALLYIVSLGNDGLFFPVIIESDNLYVV